MPDVADRWQRRDCIGIKKARGSVFACSSGLFFTKLLILHLNLIFVYLNCLLLFTSGIIYKGRRDEVDMEVGITL